MPVSRQVVVNVIKVASIRRERTSSRRPSLEAADGKEGWAGSLDKRSKDTPRDAALMRTALGLAGPHDLTPT